MIRLCVLLGFLIGIVPTSWGAVTFDASSSSARATSTTVSVNHTVGSGSDRLLIACHVNNGTSGFGSSGVTYNSVAMTLITEQQTSGNAKVALYYMVNPPVGTASVQGTTGTTQVTMITAKSFFGVNQSTPIGTHTSGNGGGTGTSYNLTVSSAVDQMVVDCIGVGDTTGLAADAGQANSVVDDGGSGPDMGSSTEAGAASVQMGWSWGSTVTRALVVAPLNASSSSAAGIRRRF